MFKNKIQRKEYLENKENWDMINDLEINGQKIFRVLKLKNVNVYTIEYHQTANKYVPDRWQAYGYFGLFTLSEDGLYQESLNTTQAIEIIRNTEEPKERINL